LAFINYVRFVERNEYDELSRFTRHHITNLFSTYGVSKLSGSESCDNLNTILRIRAIPNSQRNLPLFFYACARFYDKHRQPYHALDQLRRFLAFSPKHPLSKKVQIAAVTNQNICSQTTRFQSIANISTLPSLMPVVYINCSQASYSRMAYPQAKAYLVTLRRSYPNHSLAKDANNRLFLINREISTVKSEIYQSTLTIKRKLEFCFTTGLVGFGWVIDIWEFFTGKSCGLEERLDDWERYATILPWFGEAKQVGKASRLFNLAKTITQKSKMDKYNRALLDDESFYKLLQDKELVLLLAHHNPRLARIIGLRLNQSLSTSGKPLFTDLLK
jgi:hypothetical protein